MKRQLGFLPLNGYQSIPCPVIDTKENQHYGIMIHGTGNVNKAPHNKGVEMYYKKILP